MFQNISNILLKTHAPQIRFGNLNLCRNISSSQYVFKAFLQEITVVGGGHMGRGIAQVSAAAGNFVTLADISDSALDDSRKKIENRLRKSESKSSKGNPSQMKTEVDEIMKRIKFTTDIGRSVENCDLVVEAIPEQLDLKHKLFAELDKEAPESTIFVTNTSSIPVGEICEHLSSSRKEKFGGVHFFDAVAVKLVEVVKTPETSEDSYHKIKEWSRFIGKVPVSCKDTPGFIVNRLNIPYFIEAIRMYERGDASIKDIDIAMKLGAGYPYGPFELADYIGIDVVYMIFQGWEKRFPESHQFRCPPTIKKLYDEGKLGAKFGQGFFKYPK